MVELKYKILSLLIEHKFEEFSIREISQKLKVDYKNTYQAVQKIQNSISISKKSKSSFLSFKPTLTLDLFITEYQRRAFLESKLSLLLKDIRSVENPFFIPIIFGSYAKQTQNKHSDIDLCIIYDTEAGIKPLLQKLAIHPKVEIHTFSYEEFISMIKVTDFSVGREIILHGIVLKNIESYYEVLKHGFRS